MELNVRDWTPGVEPCAETKSSRHCHLGRDSRFLYPLASLRCATPRLLFFALPAVAQHPSSHRSLSRERSAAVKRSPSPSALLDSGRSVYRPRGRNGRDREDEMFREQWRKSGRSRMNSAREPALLCLPKFPCGQPTIAYSKRESIARATLRLRSRLYEYCVYRYIYIHISYIYYYIMGIIRHLYMSCIIVSVCSTLLVAINHCDAVHVILLFIYYIYIYYLCVRAYACTIRVHIDPGCVAERVHAYTQRPITRRGVKTATDTLARRTASSYEYHFRLSVIGRTHTAFFLSIFISSFDSLASFCLERFCITASYHCALVTSVPFSSFLLLDVRRRTLALRANRPPSSRGLGLGTVAGACFDIIAHRSLRSVLLQ